MFGLRAILIALAMVNIGGAQTAQSIAGIVLDPSGATVPEATVTIKRGRAAAQPSLKMDTSGRFRFNALPEGTYSIVVQAKGFNESTTQIRISSRPLSPLTIVLALAEVKSEITVGEASAAQVSTEADANLDAAAVDQSLLEKLPVFDQDYVSRMSGFLDSSSLGTGGTQLIVDGMQVNSVGVSASAIQEVRINQNPYAAEFARPGRGRLEIITKAAASEYHGTFNFTFRDSVLNARDAFASLRAPEQRRIYEGALTGPVGHSKTTSFLASINRQEEDLESVVFATNLAGPIQQSVPSPQRTTQAAFRLAHQINEGHLVSWQYNERDYPSSNQGIGGFVLPEGGTNIDHWEREIIFNDRWSLTPRWLSQFQILVGREHEGTTSISSTPKIVVRDAFTSGGAQVNLLRTENHVQLNEIVSWSDRKHQVKFGINVPDVSRRGVDDYGNFGGTFFFSSLQSYATQQPYAFRQQQGLGHTVYWQKELGVFLQDDYRIRPNFSLSLGIRYNWQNYLNDKNNIAPRLAFAYSPRKSRKTVFRGGSGIFYDRTGAGPLADLLLHDGQHLQSYLLTNPPYPNPLLNAALQSVQASDVMRLDSSIREPYSIQYSFGVEHQLAKHTTVAATYRGSVSISSFRSRDVNAPLGPDYVARPNPSLGVIRQIESSGRQIANALDLTLQGDISRFFTALIQYTLSRTDNNTGGIAWFPANQYDLSGEWGRADTDQRHRFNLLGSFTGGKWTNLGVGATLSSGGPYSLTTGQDPYRTGLANARPPGVNRNSLEGPGYAGLDLRWSRDWYWNRAKKEKGGATTFAVDAFNILNHVNYSAYVGNLSSPFFGQAVSALPTRRLQFTLRLKF